MLVLNICTCKIPPLALTRKQWSTGNIKIMRLITIFTLHTFNLSVAIKIIYGLPPPFFKWQILAVCWNVKILSPKHTTPASLNFYLLVCVARKIEITTEAPPSKKAQMLSYRGRYGHTFHRIPYITNYTPRRQGKRTSFFKEIAPEIPIWIWEKETKA